MISCQKLFERGGRAADGYLLGTPASIGRRRAPSESGLVR